MEFVQLPISVSNQTSLHPRLRGRWKTDLNVSSCKLNNLISVSCILPGGEGYSLQYPIPPERGTNFRLQVYERVGILLVEVHEIKGEGNLSFRWKKRPKRAIKQIHFMAVKKPRKHSGFVIHSYLKDVTFTRTQNSKLLKQYVKRVPFVNRRYTKWVPFS